MVIAKIKIGARLSALFIVLGILPTVQSCFASAWESIKDEREGFRYHAEFQKLICDTEDRNIDALYRSSGQSTVNADIERTYKSAYKLNGNIIAFRQGSEGKEKVFLSRGCDAFWSESGMLGLLSTNFFKKAGFDLSTVAKSPNVVPNWKKPEEAEFFRKILSNPILGKYNMPESLVFEKDKD